MPNASVLRMAKVEMPEHVLPARGRAEGMRRRRRHVGRDHKGVDGRIGRHERQQRHDDDETDQHRADAELGVVAQQVAQRRQHRSRHPYARIDQGIDEIDDQHGGRYADDRDRRHAEHQTVVAGIDRRHQQRADARDSRTPAR